MEELEKADLTRTSKSLAEKILIAKDLETNLETDETHVVVSVIGPNLEIAVTGEKKTDDVTVVTETTREKRTEIVTRTGIASVVALALVTKRIETRTKRFLKRVTDPAESDPGLVSASDVVVAPKMSVTERRKRRIRKIRIEIVSTREIVRTKMLIMTLI